MTFNQVAYLSLFIALLYPAKSLAQTKDLDIIRKLNEQIIPIATFDPDRNFRDIDFLKQSLKNRDIIALG